MTLESSVNLNDVPLKELVSKDLTERFINELQPKIKLEFTISKIQNKDGLASVSERLFLLAETPVLGQEQEFLELLNLLDPEVHKKEEVDSFVEKVRNVLEKS